MYLCWKTAPHKLAKAVPALLGQDDLNAAAAAGQNLIFLFLFNWIFIAGQNLISLFLFNLICFQLYFDALLGQDDLDAAAASGQN